MKDISWKKFSLGCLSLATIIYISETGNWNTHSLAAEKGQFKQAPSQGIPNSQEEMAANDLPPKMTEADLPPELKSVPQEKQPELSTPKIDIGVKTAKLKVTVINGRDKKPIEGAEVVIMETGDRIRTDAKGDTPYVDAPVPRAEKGKLLINKLHGQLGVIAYKKGYRDSITFGVRMHEGKETHITVWMYPIEYVKGEPTRIEPVFYEVPYHHLYLLQLADSYRSKPDEGEGMESPDR